MRSGWHHFKLADRVWLLDVASSSLFEIDSEAAQVLDWMGAHPQEPKPDGIAGVNDLDAVWAEIQSWQARGLFSPETPVVLPEHEPRIKALCLHIAHDCNLRCRYCFGETGAFGGDRSLMSEEVGRRALDLLLRESGERTQLEVDFFGGEPLMNLSVVRALVAYGREASGAVQKHIHFTLTTNGVLLDAETTAFLNGEGISLVLSHDGRPDVHDHMRPSAGGTPSSARVMTNIRAAAASRNGQDYYVRGTYTHDNLDFASDVKYLYDQGFRRVSVEPVIATPDEPYAIREEDLPGIFAEYDRLTAFCLERARAGDPLLFFHFAVDLEHGPCIYKRLLGCGAGHEYFAVTPAGDIYPCHQFVGRTEYRMGDVFAGISRTDLRRSFGEADIYRKNGCRDCWARYFCSGGCHANAELLNKSILEPDRMGCALLKKRLECALALKALLALDDSGSRAV